MKSQPNCLVFEFSKKERNGKTKFLKYSVPIVADIETLACFFQQLKKDGVHLRKNDLLCIGSEYMTAMVEGLRQGVIFD